MEKEKVNTIKYPATLDEKFGKIALSLGLSKKMLFTKMVEYFYRTKKDPSDINDEQLKNTLAKNHKAYTSFIKAQENLLAWKAIAKDGMADYIRYLFKTVRKFFGEAIVVTQEVEDIISSPIVTQAIINNSDCKILLDQSKYQNKFDQIQELLGLTDKEKAQILSMNRANDPNRKYKEVFISLGGQHSKVYRTEVSPSEYFSYTTEESEKMMVQQYAQKYGSIQKGIAMLVADLQQNNRKH